MPLLEQRCSRDLNSVHNGAGNTNMSSVNWFSTSFITISTVSLPTAERI